MLSVRDGSHACYSAKLYLDKTVQLSDRLSGDLN